MSGPRAPHSLRHEPQSTPLKFEEPVIGAVAGSAPAGDECLNRPGLR